MRRLHRVYRRQFESGNRICGLDGPPGHNLHNLALVLRGRLLVDALGICGCQFHRWPGECGRPLRAAGKVEKNPCAKLQVALRAAGMQGAIGNFTAVYGFAFVSPHDAAQPIPGAAHFEIRVPTMSSAPYEQDYWLACADKAYARAEGMDDPNVRLTMLSVAKGYE